MSYLYGMDYGHLKFHEKAKVQMLGLLYRVLAVLGIVALVPSVFAAWVNGFYVIASVDLIAYGLLIVIYFIHPPKYMLGLIVISTIFLGALVVFFTGSQGAGYIWFLFAIVVSALNGRASYTWVSLGFSGALLVGYGILVVLELSPVAENPWLILIITANTLTVAAVLALLILRFDKQTGEALNLQENLIHELQHRVRNNLQLLLALANLNGSDMVSRRQIVAVESFNDLLLVESVDTLEKADVSRLLNRIIRGLGESEDYHSPVIGNEVPRGFYSLAREEAALVAVSLMELLSLGAGIEGQYISRVCTAGPGSLLLEFQNPSIIEDIDAHPFLRSLLPGDCLRYLGKTTSNSWEFVLDLRSHG